MVAISKRWPEPERAYRAWYRERDKNDFGLGGVANLVAQHGMKAKAGVPPTRYEAVASGLATVAELALARGASVHTISPELGKGAGLCESDAGADADPS